MRAVNDFQDPEIKLHDDPTPLIHDMPEIIMIQPRLQEISQASHQYEHRFDSLCELYGCVAIHWISFLS